MKCPENEAFIHAYVDGEIAGEERGRFQEHLLACPSCANAVRAQERFRAAVRGHLAPVAAPEALRQRITQDIARLGGEAEPAWFAFWRSEFWKGWFRWVPIAAAAAGFAAFFISSRAPVSSVIEQAARTHSKEIPMDVVAQDCARVASWFSGKVDFPVRPLNLASQGHCEGGRIINVRDRFGALLRYQMRNGRRLSMMVFDGDEEPVSAPRRRRVAGQDVYFGNARGASTAAFRGRDGLWYVVASDLDEDGLSNVMETAFHPVR